MSIKMKKLIIVIIFLQLALIFFAKPIKAQGTYQCRWSPSKERCVIWPISDNCEADYTTNLAQCLSFANEADCNGARPLCVWSATILPYEKVIGFEGFRRIFGENQDITFGKIISRLLPYIFVVAGLILFIYLILGGYGFLFSAGNPDSIKKAQDKITNALVGFLLIFIAYWLTQVIEVVFGVKIF